jgi:hypothetical protein
MTEKQLKAIEKKFGIKLPKSYRDLLLKPPPILLALLKWDDNDNEECQTPLFRTPKLISDLNEECHLAGAENFEFRWPDKFFIIGGDCGGNYYCIKPKTKKTAVFEWQHDSNEFEKCAGSIREFVRHIFDFYAEVASWDLDD